MNIKPLEFSKNMKNWTQAPHLKIGGKYQKYAKNSPNTIKIA